MISMRRILQNILTFFARLTILRYRPTIIAVTGSVGKTSTKDAIACVVGTQCSVRSSGGNLNNELGVPLSILGDWTEEYYSHGSSFWFWFKVFVVGIWRLIIPCKYPEFLVLEYGADRQGDIKRLAAAFKPCIGVITAVGEIPVHVEFFAGPEAIANEKSELIKALKPTGYAILNADDLSVLDMGEKTKAQVRTFGFSEHANSRISNFEMMVDAMEKPYGIMFKLHDSHSFVPIKIHGSLGRSLAMTAAAAAAIADILEIHLVSVSEALSDYHGPAGRSRILEGIRGSVILDDTYNASPIAMRIALETLHDVPAKRRIAVLGDMRELGRYTLQAHEEIGNRAAETADILVCVGEKGKLIADAAANQMPKDNIYIFHTADDARTTVQSLVQAGDVVLVKGSQSMRMEKIVEEIMAYPERKRELLVRQSASWLAK